MENPEPLEVDYTLEEVAAAMRMSTRWIRNLIRAGEKGEGPAVEYTRRGHKIFFTADQVEKLRAFGTTKAVAPARVTTGRKRSRPL